MMERRRERNVGVFDRTLRLVAGAMLLGLYGALLPPWKYLTLFGLVLIGTALSGRCPVYSLLGISTRSGPTRSGPTR